MALKFKAIGLYFRKIKDIIYNNQKLISANSDSFNIFFLIFRESSIKKQTSHSNYSVHRSSYLMAHKGKKFTFCFNRSFSLNYSKIQFHIFLYQLFLKVNILDNRTKGSCHSH